MEKKLYYLILFERNLVGYCAVSVSVLPDNGRITAIIRDSWGEPRRKRHMPLVRLTDAEATFVQLTDIPEIDPDWISVLGEDMTLRAMISFTQKSRDKGIKKVGEITDEEVRISVANMLSTNRVVDNL